MNEEKRKGKELYHEALDLLDDVEMYTVADEHVDIYDSISDRLDEAGSYRSKIEQILGMVKRIVWPKNN